ncbi:WD40-repeat-containing domain protein [Earliella scabrosa]|nr:WD40-repeat-containing domain protein [Earliella scabrosa]
MHYQFYPSHWQYTEELGYTRFHRHYAVYFSEKGSCGLCRPDHHASTIEIFNMQDRHNIAVPLSIDACILALSFSPDGSRIMVCFEDATVKTWELATQTEVYSFQDSYAEASITKLCSATFSPDANHVLLGYSDHTMRLLRIADGTCLPTFPLNARPKFLQFTPDGKTLCMAMVDGCVSFEPIGHLLS